jgi:hypothetical protein
MKNLWKILMIGALAAMFVLPQTAAAGVKFGIKGGANIANVNGDFGGAIADWKSSVGFCAGIFLELNFDYIEIPVLLKLRIPAGSFHPFVFAGPAFGFNLKAVLEGIEVDNMPTADYSAVLGGGLQLGRSIHIDVRYTMGLQKLEIPDLDTIDLKNGVLSATIGLAF